jgi:hypothetical protein
MNRPANPYRDEHRRLTAEGNEAAGRGDHAESMRLWNKAAALKRQGQQEIERMMKGDDDGSGGRVADPGTD